MRCDSALNETCDILGSFLLIEEVINSVLGESPSLFFVRFGLQWPIDFIISVFLIRFAERHIDKMLDGSLLEYTPPSLDASHVQFESEWSLFRSPFKRKASSFFGSYNKESQSQARSYGSGLPHRSPSPQNLGFDCNSYSNPSSATNQIKPSTSLQQSFIASSSLNSTPLIRDALGMKFDFEKDSSKNVLPKPEDVEIFLTLMNMLLVDSGINPAFICQIWSQVLYWVACEFLFFSVPVTSSPVRLFNIYR